MKHPWTSALLLLSLCLLSTGCLLPQRGTHSAPATTSPTSLQPETDCAQDFLSCTRDDDCTRAQAGCCACDQGGSEVAISRRCLDAFLARPQRCGEEVCTPVYSCLPDETPRCIDGKCILSPP